MYDAIRYCQERLCYYERKIPIGIIFPFRSADDGNIPGNEMQYIEQIAKEFSVPVLNLYTTSRIIPDKMTPGGSNYYLGITVHLGGNSILHVERIIGKWMVYCL